MRVKVVFNPKAAHGRKQQYAATIREVGHALGEVDLVFTERPGHGRELARRAVAEGYDLVAAAGGDGTVHEVVNGLISGDRADLPLGIIPIGTGNDLAFGLGLPDTVEGAVARLFQGRPRTLDLGRIIDDRGRVEVFENNLGIGFDAVVVIRAERLTRLHGFPMYLAAVLDTIAFYYNTPQMEMRFDQEVVNQPVLFLAFGLGRRHGGGFLLTPDARHDDDRIDTCLVNPVSRMTMLSMLTRAMKGTHITSPHVTMRQNREIAVRSESPMPIHIDGEVFSYPQDNVRQVTIASLPAAIQVMV